MIPREPHGPCRSGLLVPIDDETCWFYLCRWNPYGPLEGAWNEAPRDGMVPGTWLGKAKLHQPLPDRPAGPEDGDLQRHPQQHGVAPRTPP